MNMNKIIYSIILSLSLVTGTLSQAQGQTSNVNVYVLVSPTTHQLDLKTIEGESSAKKFVIKPQSVVQVRQGDNLVVFTQPTNTVDKVKVTDASDVITTLDPLPQNNMYSLAGFPVGSLYP
jgi:predicted S18 family serine protease